jgi:hypothetical protein
MAKTMTYAERKQAALDAAALEADLWQDPTFRGSKKTSKKAQRAQAREITREDLGADIALAIEARVARGTAIAKDIKAHPEHEQFLDPGAFKAKQKESEAVAKGKADAKAVKLLAQAIANGKTDSAKVKALLEATLGTVAAAPTVAPELVAPVKEN